jgi:hypothetical protein
LRAFAQQALYTNVLYKRFIADAVYRLCLAVVGTTTKYLDNMKVILSTVMICALHNKQI